METNKNIFICYGKEDFEAASRIYNIVSEAGYKPWMDKINLFGGQNWKIAISNAIKESRFVLAVLSHHSVKRRGFVNREIVEALEMLKEYPQNDIFLIPVKLDKCDFSNTQLNDIHWIEMFPN